MTRMQTWLAALLAIGAATVTRAETPLEIGPEAGVSGVVTTTRPASDGVLTVTQDEAMCGGAVPDQRLVVADGRLANAVVWLEGLPAGTIAAPGEATLDQRGCVYAPHVQAATQGSALTIVNSDAVLHNSHATHGARTAFNVAMPDLDQRITSSLRRTGLLEVKCDAGHDWMRAWIWVFDHPWFAVTGADGAFALPPAPPGNYTLKVWHEVLGTSERPVLVTDAPTRVDVALE